MYKAIIIDDEPWTIIDIEKTFSLEDMGFEIVGSYRTPQKALPAIISKKPDLVITDIRMPGMTGMELIKSVRNQKINCEFIIVSGHSDFSYAQEAISYGVAGYCLKPLDPHETSEALNRAKNHLDSRKTITPEPSYLDDNFEGLRNYIITHFSEKLTLKSLAAEFNMNPNYCCSLFTKYLGQTFSAYLTELRITEAQNLLHNSDYSLEEIASLVGFKDYFYFSKVFKKYCKYSPKEYRTLPHDFSQQEECRIIRHTYRLLHIMCYHNDSIIFFQFHRKVFYLRCRDRIQCRCRFIHKEHFRLYRQCSCNTKSLLLAA